MYFGYCACGGCVHAVAKASTRKRRNIRLVKTLHCIYCMLYALLDRAIISVLLIYSVVVYCRALKIDGVAKLALSWSLVLSWLGPTVGALGE
jgi:hypothetical protein